MPSRKRSFGHAENESGHESSTVKSNALNGLSYKRSRVSAEPAYDSSDDLTDEETQHMQATQFHQLQNQKPRQINHPQENGIIESVTLTNFMCHDYLQVDIGPLVNFIIGHNGSGKSAVLTALTICLGGKASATNRAGSLKAFVKAGQESCTVSVKIKNQGETAYQASVYGDTIIVERSFTISGSSGFKLKNSSGRLISTKRSDLEDITDFYALQLDNPMSVLTQDNARQFLNASSPSDKYKFFMKGVQLEQLNQDYELLQESIQQIENTFEEKVLHIGSLKSKREKAEANWNALERADNIRDEINLQRVKMAWSQVRDQENVLQSYDDDLRDIAHKITTSEQHVLQMTHNFEVANRKYEEAESKAQQLSSEYSAKTDEKSVVKEEFENVKKEMMTAHHEQRQIGAKIKHLKETMNSTEQDIREEMRRLEEVNGGSLIRRFEELQAKKDEVKAARRRVEDHKAGMPALQQSFSKATLAIETYDGVKRSKESDLRACESRLKDLRQRGNRRNGYPQGIDTLLKDILQDPAFDEKPIGPIGHYIQLKEPIWASILERSLGGALNGFIVTSKSDQIRLDSMMQRLKCKCPIFIGNHGSFDTHGHEPALEFTTVLRVLDISNDLVKRQLVINQGIEQTILVKDLAEARTIMHNERLKNVRQCFSINPNLQGCGVRFSYGQGTSLKSDPIDAYKNPHRLRTHIQDHINFEENQLEGLRRETREAEVYYQNLQTSAAESRQVIARHLKIGENLKIDAQRADLEVENLQTTIDNESVEEGRLDTLRQNLDLHQEEKETNERLYEDAVLERDKHDSALAKIKRSLDSIDVELVSIQKNQKLAATVLAKLTEGRRKVLVEKNEAFDVETKLKAEQGLIQTSRNQIAEIVIDWSGKATGIGERVPILSDETSLSIEQKLAKLDDEMKLTEQRAGGDRRKVAEARRVATKTYEEALNQYSNEKALADLLKQSLQLRRDRWGYFRKKIVARARCTFLHVLSERSFTGKLKVDHQARKLEVAIQPDQTQRDKQTRETTTLSGGEKSYSTICLLLALWDAVGAPIRCLDEFDVFMDSVNRDQSMKLIIKWARNSIGRQFILISPQAGIADRSRDVKIIRMPDPVTNGQTRLNV